MKGNGSTDDDNLWTPQLEKLFINIMLKEINESQVFLDALQRPENNFPWPPSGKIYCCLTCIFTIFKFNPFTMSYFCLYYYYFC